MLGILENDGDTNPVWRQSDFLEKLKEAWVAAQPMIEGFTQPETPLTGSFVAAFAMPNPAIGKPFPTVMVAVKNQVTVLALYGNQWLVNWLERHFVNVTGQRVIFHFYTGVPDYGVNRPIWGDVIRPAEQPSYEYPTVTPTMSAFRAQTLAKLIRSGVTELELGALCRLSDKVLATVVERRTGLVS